MAVGVDVIRTTGRLVFDLQRGEDVTTRTIDIPNPITDTESTELQNAVNTANTLYTGSGGGMNTFVQPSTWRDAQITEEQWTTTGVRYEVVTVTTRAIEPD